MMPMRLAVVAVLVAGAPAQTPPRQLIACKLLTVDEVGKFSSAGPVEVDPRASGEDADGSTGCTWQTKGSTAPPVVILTVENGDTPGMAERMLGTKPQGDRVTATFSLRKVQTFGDPPPPTPVAGLGDEALYRDFQRVKGGALLVRRGNWIVTFSGSAPKDAYIALARLVLQRIGAGEPAPAIAVQATSGSRPITLEPGLVVVSAIHDETMNKDYESVARIDSVTPEGMRSSENWTIPDPQSPGGVRRQTASRFSRAEDLKSARRLILWHLPGDPETQPGSTGPTPSAAVLEEIRTRGEAAIVVGAVSRSDSGLGGLFAGRKYFRGTVKRIGEENLRVLVDGTPLMLATVHVAGTVTVGSDSGDVAFWWLTDPATRFALRFTFQGSVAQIVRIDRPAASEQAGGAHARELQQALASKACRAEVPGIYFLTDSAELLSASEPAIARIAEVLRNQPGWTVTIEGHTDNTGGDAYNLGLSRRRAEALKDALVERFAIAAARLQTEGYGRTRPVDTNDTLDGRAHNRRVEITRKC
jgi:outer membrane protein OmpA-like peptidoglycan-associated protein